MVKLNAMQSQGLLMSKIQELQEQNAQLRAALESSKMKMNDRQSLVDVADRRLALLKMYENDRISFGNRCPFCYSPGSKHIESCRLAKELSDG